MELVTIILLFIEEYLNGGVLSAGVSALLVGFGYGFGKIWHSIPCLTGGARCFKWVSRLGTYRDGNTEKSNALQFFVLPSR